MSPSYVVLGPGLIITTGRERVESAAFFLCKGVELFLGDFAVFPLCLVFFVISHNGLVLLAEDFTDALLHFHAVFTSVANKLFLLDEVGLGEGCIGNTLVPVDVVDGFAGFTVDFGLVVVVVLCIKDERDSLRLFCLVLLLLVYFFVGGQYDLKSLRLDHGGTEHEERDKEHVHVNHRCKVHADGRFFLGAFFLFAAVVLSYFCHGLYII